VARLRVPCGFLLVAAFAWYSDPTAPSASIGLTVAAAGMGLRAWAAGHLSKNKELARSGPYAWTRNPLYLGTLLVALGLATASRSLGLALLFAAVFACVYLPVIELEEQHLRTLFPEYAAYAAVTPRLGFRRPPPGSPRKPFNFHVYLENQEYQALSGFLAGALLIIWRVLL
jgi:protein-S-isoprenylcysteine O-methyltransferase Ste14